MPELTPGLGNPLSAIDPIGIGVKVGEFIEEFISLTKELIPLTYKKKPIGYIGITPTDIILGSNRAISSIDMQNPKLAINVIPKVSLTERYATTPTANIAQALYALTSNIGAEFTYNSLEELKEAMLELLQENQESV